MAELAWSWRWTLAAPPAKLWPAVSDTDSFNRSLGLAPVASRPLAETGRAPQREVRMRHLGREIVWSEEPFEFEEPRRFSFVRRYRTGPVAEMRGALELEANGGGTDLTYTVRARPRSALLVPAIRFEIGVRARRSFDRAFRRIERAVAGDKPPYRDQPALGEDLRPKLAQALPGPAAPLLDFLTSASELELWKIRPFRVARQVGLERDRGLHACLEATRAGILDAVWTIVCPHCRGTTAESEDLSGLQFDARCESCSVDFRSDFDRLTELTFRLAPRWKKLDVGDYCVGGPGRTPHVAVQLLLDRGEKQSRRLELAPGTYRLRASVATRALPLRAAGDGAPEASISVGSLDADSEALVLGSASVVHFVNDSREEALVQIERTAWADDACSAAYVSTFQEYRDLFGADVLAPGVSVQIGTMAILFTDLKDSTALYGRVGDAPAFGLVRTHFDLLREVVRRQRGAVVKTIGDAVMAAFLDSADALEAALDMHRSIARLQAPDGLPVVLKIGMHAGPCFAVTMNGILDYFGTTVNLAARIQGLSTGGDVVLERDLASKAGIRERVSGLRREEFEAEMKGFAARRSFARIFPF